jgi:single-stranded DNA-binding protein
MNRVFISGMITEGPVMRMERGEVPHLILAMCVRHRTQGGETRREVYRVSAWHEAAKWGVENLRKGQIVGVQGYLTQRQIRAEGITGTVVEIAADEFFPICMTARETGEAQELPQQ